MTKKATYILIAVTIVAVIYLLSKVTKNKQLRRLFEGTNLKYFTYDEFDTPAVVGVDSSSDMYQKNGRSYVKNSGLKNMDPKFLDMLVKARDIVEKEYNAVNPGSKIIFRINSGYRSPAYNEYLDSSTNYQVAKTSPHMTGQAVDIDTSPYNTAQHKVMLDAMVRAGFNRFGLASNFIHIDSDQSKTPNITWNYGPGSIALNPFNLA